MLVLHDQRSNQDIFTVEHEKTVVFIKTVSENSDFLITHLGVTNFRYLFLKGTFTGLFAESPWDFYSHF